MPMPTDPFKQLQSGGVSRYVQIACPASKPIIITAALESDAVVDTADGDTPGTIADFGDFDFTRCFPFKRVDDRVTTLIFSFGYDNAFANVSASPGIVLFGATDWANTPPDLLDWRAMKTLDNEYELALTVDANDFLSPHNNLKWTTSDRLDVFDCRNFNRFAWGIKTPAAVSSGNLNNAHISVTGV